MNPTHAEREPARDVAALRDAVRGTVILPSDSEYDEARRVWNGTIDRRPSVIVRCATAQDVAESLRVARVRSLPIAVRGGGHNVAGSAVCDGGLVIDLRDMRSVQVDPRTARARVGGGATWADVDRATAEHGLATTGGLISSTGVGGLTLGGGIGWLMRRHGLSCDNMVGADLVTADGHERMVSDEEHPDLMWGLRGGGGNFGVVTCFEFRLHPVRMVLGGVVMHEANRAADVLRFWRDYIAQAPDTVTTMAAFLNAPPAPFVPAALHGRPVLGVVVCAIGDRADAELAVKPLRAFGPPVVDAVAPMPYPALQSILDAGSVAGRHNYFRAGYANELTDDAVDTLVDHARRVPGPLSQIHLQHMGGAVSRVPADATAYPHRDATIAYNVVATWVEPRDADAHVTWARTAHDAMAPFSTGGVYVNFLGEEGQDRVRAAYGEATYARLAALKRVHDPHNVFRANQNIRP